MGKSKKKSRKRSRSRSPSDNSDSSSSSRSRSRSPSRKKSKKSHKHSKRKHESTSSSSTSASTSTSTSIPTPTLTKEQIKAMETPEQRQARRLAKKQKKEEKKKQESSLYGYTDESNPFGDANLTQAFVWKKKYEKILSSGGDPRQISKAAIQEKQIELRREIDQVKERRKQREIEREAMEEMREMMRREADKEAVEGWEEKEEEFHRKQAKTRTAIRITAGREKAIDILAKNLYLLDSQNDDSIPVNWDVELTEPYRIFDGLLIYDLQELKKDIQGQIELGVHLDYWNALLTVCDNEIHQQQGMAAGGKQRASAIPASVARDVQGILGGKSVNELDSLEIDIKDQIRASNDGSGAIVDVVYWEAILQELAVYKAKAFLHEFHANLLKTRLKQLKQQSTSSAAASVKAPVESVKDEEDDYEKEFQHAAEDEVAEDDGSFSPVLHADEGDEEALAIVDAEEDARELEAQRRMVLEQRQAEERERLARDKAKGVPASAAVSGGEPDAFARESAKPMMGDEVAFNNGEITLEETSYSWHDKYRPRKPRYFNRVKTGFEWNRYNQTHYDKENPPPKIVQGYKFNLFYPDLIDPTKAPTYRVDPDPDNPDYCTIRFSAGPPYEDIAFKIVRKEWEYTPKRGFKCVFDKGVLHLYFNFKRYFYRR